MEENKKSPAQVTCKSSKQIVVTGPVEITFPDGRVELRERPRVTFCGCGQSQEHPICDGSHKNA